MSFFGRRGVRPRGAPACGRAGGPTGRGPRPLAYRAPRADLSPTADTDVIKNLYMPLWILGGVLVEVAAALLIPLGFLPGLVTQSILYSAMIGALFDLDHGDRWYCVLVIFLVELAIYFALFAYLAWGRSRRRAAGLD